ncbi:MAG: alanine racemase [Tepidanaerobacteraceae bacterium]|jgi:D-serine deaminase-like pyridoxal phosphate-dependent protein|nr:alanine racemase [Tepidanaerobacteraceae bacterium]
MDIKELTTPSFLLDLDVLEKNINDMAELCKNNNKRLWPMVKTHKSTQIARMQRDAGAEGFLVGTLDEAEKLAKEGFLNIMLAYPTAGEANVARVISLAQKAHVILSLDGLDAAKALNEAAKAAGLMLEYLIIIDSGLHRFGVLPKAAGKLAVDLSFFEHLKLAGIGTHPGHVYGASSSEEVRKVANEEINAMKQAGENLKEAGFAIDIVATGSTPTAAYAAADKNITMLRPGNYVFYDNIQIALGTVLEKSCALCVLATIISRPGEDTFIMDAGSKCFGLDKGAHGISLVKGYGVIKDHPELLITDLSEEVGKIKILGKTEIKVGDKIRVIPNHACSAANMTDYLIGHRNGNIEKTVYIDIRGGSFRKPPVE